MRILIIEDEKPAAEKLKRMLKVAYSNIEPVAVLESVEQSINWFIDNPEPDLVFMDIQLEDGTCFEIFESIKVDTPVIFITAYDEYTLRAFKVNSVDYLLKPLQQNDLNNAIKKFRQLHTINPGHKKLEQLIQQFNMSKRERLLIKTGPRYKSIQIADILYFFIRERAVFINAGSDVDYAIDYSLEQAEKIVDPERFFRINRNYLINISAILDIFSYSSNRLKLTLENQPENQEIIVSRERVRDFKKWMNR